MSSTIEDVRFPGLTLREVSLDDGIEVWAMLREIGPGENGFGNEGHSVAYSRFRRYLRRRIDLKSGIDLPDGRVPMTTYWLFRGALPVGMGKLRHQLTDSLRRVGGHVGYCIRPSQRGRGYGNALLALILTAASRAGLEEVLVTCKQDNLPSRRVAEYNGAELECVEEFIAYYWIACRSPHPVNRRGRDAAVGV